MGPYERLFEAIKRHSGMDAGRIKDAGNHGADTGWPGFTYNKDAEDFYTENEDDIYELLREMAENTGSKNIEDLVSGFKRDDMLETPRGRRVLLAWFALEEIGRWIGEETETV